MVEADGLVAEFGQHSFDVGLGRRLQRVVHQAVGRARDQASALAHDVQRHRDGNDRVQPAPACGLDGQQPHQHTGRGGNVGEEVARISVQRDRSGLLGLARHRPGQGPVEDRAEHRQQQAEVQILQRLRVQYASHGGPDDGHRGGKDQHAFETTGKVLGLVMTIGMVLIGRPRCHRDHGQRKHGPGQVDQRLHRVGQQADAPADPPGTGFQRDSGQRNADRNFEVGANLQGSKHSRSRGRTCACPPARRRCRRSLSGPCR